MIWLYQGAMNFKGGHELPISAANEFLYNRDTETHDYRVVEDWLLSHDGLPWEVLFRCHISMG